MKKLWEKRNNKGFSLVELIVVILIMAVIAVALAPQVMKWVGTSKESTDENNKGTLESAASAAVADYMTTHPTVPPTVFKVDATAATPALVISAGGDGTAAGSLYVCLEEVLNGKYPKVQSQAGDFYITINSKGKVDVTIATAAPAVPTP